MGESAVTGQSPSPRRAGVPLLGRELPLNLDLSRRELLKLTGYTSMAAFLAAIIGGFNQVRGAILGGVILGVLDNLSAAYLSSQYRGAFPLLILIAVILLRPQGLLGRIEERTV